MGNNVGGHYSAYQKERLGWLDDGVSPPITTVPAAVGTATFDIAPLEDARNGLPRALKIPRTDRLRRRDRLALRRGAAGEGLRRVPRRQRQRALRRARAQGHRRQPRRRLPARHDAVDERVERRRAGRRQDVHRSAVGREDRADLGGLGRRARQRHVPARELHARRAGDDARRRAAPCGRRQARRSRYTVQAQNRDGCGCAPTAFDVGAAVPAGWGATRHAHGERRTGRPRRSRRSSSRRRRRRARAFYPLTITAKSVSAPTLRRVRRGDRRRANRATTAPPPPPPPPTATGQLTATVSTASSSYQRPALGFDHGIRRHDREALRGPGRGRTVSVKVDCATRAGARRRSTGTTGERHRERYRFATRSSRTRRAARTAITSRRRAARTTATADPGVRVE